MTMMGGLLLIMIIKASLVTSTIIEVQSKEGVAMDMEDRAQQVLDRIAFEIMGSDYETLQPFLQEPSDSYGITYQLSFGLQDGVAVWSDPQEIAKEQNDSIVYWQENVGQVGGRRLTWTRWASDYLEGEIPNGIDDNGNGLVDEKGLSFALKGREVTIRLTLERADQDGAVQLFTFERKVTCRN